MRILMLFLLMLFVPVAFSACALDARGVKLEKAGKTYSLDEIKVNAGSKRPAPATINSQPETKVP